MGQANEELVLCSLTWTSSTLDVLFQCLKLIEFFQLTC